MKNPFTYPFNYLRAWLTYRAAVIRADLQFSTTGNRHYVIPSARHRKLIVTSFNEEVHSQGLSNKHAIRPDYSHPRTLMKQAFYYTPSIRAKTRWIHGMPRSLRQFRKKMFFTWYFSHNA